MLLANIKYSHTNYEVTGDKAFMNQIVGWVRMFLFAFMFIGDFVVQALGGPTQCPEFIKDFSDYVSNNKMQFGLMVFFLGSMIQAQLMQSGAFEIYINGNLEYSKLQTGKMPDFNAIQLIFRKYDIEAWEIF